jgi:hypothetical protein
MVIKWSEIYFNSSNSYMMGSGTTAYNPYAVQLAFAHEMGHALGLAHHPENNHLMRPNVVSTDGSLPNGPTDPGDIGTYTNPACGAPTSSRGIRCIYLWTAS